jgi:hypothetical protein
MGSDPEILGPREAEVSGSTTSGTSPELLEPIPRETQDPPGGRMR